MDGYTAGGCKHGLDAALEFYAHHGTPWAALYVGKPASGHGNVLFQNWSGKYEEVDDVINVIRDRFEGTGTDDRTRYYLTWWDEKPTINQAKKIPMDRAAQSVQFVTATPEQLARFGSSTMLQGQNNEIASRLAAIEERLSEPEETEEHAGGTDNIVGVIMQNPAIMQVIQGLIMRAVDKIIPNAPGAPVGIAGVDDGEKLTTALQILKAADPHLEDDLLRLAKLAQEDPGQFNFLLKMLRK
jgi:hypothetical protein